MYVSQCIWFDILCRKHSLIECLGTPRLFLYLLLPMTYTLLWQRIQDIYHLNFYDAFDLSLGNGTSVSLLFILFVSTCLCPSDIEKIKHKQFVACSVGGGSWSSPGHGGGQFLASGCQNCASAHPWQSDRYPHRQQPPQQPSHPAVQPWHLCRATHNILTHGTPHCASFMFR